jgi:hypothetical protein
MCAFYGIVPKENGSEVPIMSYLFSQFEAVDGLCRDTVTGAHRIPPYPHCTQTQPY